MPGMKIQCERHTHAPRSEWVELSAPHFLPKDREAIEVRALNDGETPEGGFSCTSYVTVTRSICLDDTAHAHNEINGRAPFPPRLLLSSLSR